MSETNRKLLLEIARVGGIYANELCEAAGLERAELVYRGKELETQELIQVEHLTDRYYGLHLAVKDLLGELSNQLVCAMLK